MSVDTYLDLGKRYLENLDGYSPVSEESITVDGMAAIRHRYNLYSDGDLVKGMQVYLVKEATAWVLTYTSDSSCWQQYEPIFNHITDSFHFLD